MNLARRGQLVLLIGLLTAITFFSSGCTTKLKHHDVAGASNPSVQDPVVDPRESSPVSLNQSHIYSNPGAGLTFEYPSNAILTEQDHIVMVEGEDLASGSWEFSLVLPDSPASDDARYAASQDAALIRQSKAEGAKFGVMTVAHVATPYEYDSAQSEAGGGAYLYFIDLYKNHKYAAIETTDGPLGKHKDILANIVSSINIAW